MGAEADRSERGRAAPGDAMNNTTHAIVRVKLAPQIVERLREEIVTGVWAPGEALPANVLSAKFGVSHIPIREALLVLESEGFLSLAPNRMAIVTEPTVDATADKLVLLRSLEGLAAELACMRADQGDIGELEQLQQQMEAHFAAKDRKRYHAANQQFHRRIISASRNASLADFHQTLTRHLEWARVRSGIRQELIDEAPVQHAQLISALREHKAEVARRLAEEHFTLVSDRILEGLRRQH